MRKFICLFLWLFSLNCFSVKIVEENLESDISYIQIILADNLTELENGIRWVEYNDVHLTIMGSEKPHTCSQDWARVHRHEDGKKLLVDVSVKIPTVPSSKGKGTQYQVWGSHVTPHSQYREQAQLIGTVWIKKIDKR